MNLMSVLMYLIRVRVWCCVMYVHANIVGTICTLDRIITSKIIKKISVFCNKCLRHLDIVFRFDVWGSSIKKLSYSYRNCIDFLSSRYNTCQFLKLVIWKFRQIRSFVWFWRLIHTYSWVFAILLKLSLNIK